MCSIETSILASAIVGVLDPGLSGQVTAGGLQTERAGEPGELRLVGRVARRAGEAETGDPRPRQRRPRSSSSTSPSAQPVRLGHEDGELARLDGVGVERDVDGVGALERRSTAPSPVWIPLASMNSTSGGSRLRAPIERDVLRRARRRRRAPCAAAFPTRCRTARSRACSGRRARRSRRPPGTPRRAASASIAPTCEQQQPPRTIGRSGSSEASSSVCSASVSASITRASGYGQLVERRLGHRLAARRPRRAGRGRGRRRTRGRRSGTGTRGRARPRSACGSRDSGRGGGSRARTYPARAARGRPYPGRRVIPARS